MPIRVLKTFFYYKNEVNQLLPLIPVKDIGFSDTLPLTTPSFNGINEAFGK